MDTQGTFMPEGRKDKPVCSKPIKKPMQHNLVKNVNAGHSRKAPEPLINLLCMGPSRQRAHSLPPGLQAPQIPIQTSTYVMDWMDWMDP